MIDNSGQHSSQEEPLVPSSSSFLIHYFGMNSKEIHLVSVGWKSLSEGSKNPGVWTWTWTSSLTHLIDVFSSLEVHDTQSLLGGGRLHYNLIEAGGSQDTTLFWRMFF